MLKISRFIREHKLISTLVIAIIIALIILVTTVFIGKKTGRSIWIFNGIYNSAEKPLTKASQKASEKGEELLSSKDLVEENKKLSEENIKLKEKIVKNSLDKKQLEELENLSKALNYDFAKGDGKVVTADIIDMDMTNWTGMFTIGAGTSSGIKAGDNVIAGEGLVGKVYSTGKTWSKVIPLIDQQSKVSFRVVNNLDLIGIAEGTNQATLKGFMLDGKASLSVGDEVITSGMGNYPQGIKIGKITKAAYDNNKQLMEVTIKPTVSYSKLTKVTVII